MTSCFPPPFPLTPLQHGMLVQTLLAPASGVNVEQVVCRLAEPVDAERLERAWSRMVRRHGVLRTRFRWAGIPDPEQEVVGDVQVEIARHDHAGLAPRDAEERLARWLAADRGRGFDLTRAPALRLALFRRGDEEHVLVWSFHHVLLDGRSVTHLLREVFESYDAEAEGRQVEPPARRPFREHVEWLRARGSAADQAYWAGLLRGLGEPAPVRPVRRRPRDAGAEPPFGGRELRLGEAATAALRAFEREQGVWLNTLVQGAWALLLGRYTGRREAVFGVVRGGRGGAAGAEEMVGLLINTVPVRIPLPAGARVIDWLDDLGERTAALLPHEHAALPDIARWSGLPPGAPLFDTVLDYQPQPFDAPLRALGARWQRRGFRILRRAGLPLTVAVSGEARLRVTIDYAAALFDAAAVDRMLGHFARLLAEIVADPARRLGELDPMDDAERRLVVEAWNGAPAGLPHGCVHHRFEQQAARTPHAVAVAFGDDSLTYGELNARANRLARHLAGLGVGPDVRVGLCLERSLELVVSLLGVLKAGGAWVPLDPGLPAGRLAFVLADCGAAVVVTQERLRTRLPAAGVEVVRVDAAWPEIASQSAENPGGHTPPESLAYVIYTSGSTGAPKGVGVEHRALAGHMAWFNSAFAVTAEDRVLQKTPIGFDASVWEFFAPLLAGGRLVVAPPGAERDPRRLAATVRRGGITLLQLVPPLFRVLLDEAELGECTALRALFCGGEALAAELCGRLARLLPRARPVNLYGPTECCIQCTTHRWTGDDDGQDGTVPIGRPAPGTAARVLDRALRPVPIGVPGELCLGGVQLARGYLGRPALTAAAFVPDPFGRAGARLYRTGDGARWRDDGVLEYLGRLDEQVKIRGHRVEVGEVEAALRRHPGVADCAVVAREDEPGERRLVAYVVGPAGADELRAHLRRALPEPMVPSAFVPLAALPLSPSGKVERRALPAPDPAAGGERYLAPRTPVERALAAIWADALRLERVGVRDDFLAIGGHSLVATRVVARIRAELDGDIGVTTLFENPTIEALAPFLSRRADRAPPPLAAGAGSSPHRLLASLDALSDEELDRLLAGNP